ncbi:GNAT family N-acetyltransferase [Paraburkholderia sp. SIMBA_009]
MEFDDAHEVGWMFAADLERKGYATEAAVAGLTWLGRDGQNLQAVCLPENVASLALAVMKTSLPRRGHPFRRSLLATPDQTMTGGWRVEPRSAVSRQLVADPIGGEGEDVSGLGTCTICQRGACVVRRR